MTSPTDHESALCPEKTCGERLVEAAQVVFSREGLKGATTREIAREAGVNEVTLFRHFESKANLLAAVLERLTKLQLHELENLNPDPADLRKGLVEFARCYRTMLHTDEGMIRTLIGETNRFPELAEKVTHRCAAPWRESLGNYLTAHQATSHIRPDVSLPVFVDLFTGIFLSSMLRQTSPWKAADYDDEEFLKESVDVLIHGIELPRD